MSTNNKKHLFEELKKIQAAIASKNLEEGQIETFMNRVEEILISTRFTHEQEREMLALFGTTLYPYYEKYIFEPTVVQEQEIRNLLLEAESPDFHSIQTKGLLYNKFPELVKNEIRSVDVTAADTVAFIGSGPFPLTALLYHHFSGATVHCVEFSHQSCIESRMLIKSLGLSNKITVIESAGENLRDEGYALVSVAAQAHPREAILKHLARILAPGTKVLFRTQTGLGVILDEPESNVDKIVLQRFTFSHEVIRDDGMMKSLVYEVK